MDENIPHTYDAPAPYRPDTPRADTDPAPLSLADRLTDEDKNRLRKLYAEETEAFLYNMKKANSSMSIQCRAWFMRNKEVARGCMILLRSLFGDSLFDSNEK